MAGWFSAAMNRQQNLQTTFETLFVEREPTDPAEFAEEFRKLAGVPQPEVSDA